MSITTSYVILFVIVARLFLKKAPKIFSYALWSVVLFRLIFPFSFESIFSLIYVNTQTVPKDIVYTQTPQIQSGITTVDNIINNSFPAPAVGASANPVQIWITLGGVLWLVGIIVLLTYSIITALRLSKKLKSAKLVLDNIYAMNGIKTAFIFGIVDPKIYLPTDLSETERAYIIEHEQTHIKRLDHIIKPFAFLVLCVHWFNPLVWIAFSLMSEDMELSCDESVIRKMGSGIKKDYSTSLLALSTGKKIIGGCPLAFGENNTKGRIMNVLNYKKPRFWIIFLLVILVVVVCIGLISDPFNKQNLLTPKAFLEKWELDIINPPTKFSITIPKDWEVRLGEYPEGLYWGLANEFSKEVGLDLTSLKGENVEVYIYELKDGLPGYDEQSKYTYPSKVTILVKDNNTVGAWLNFNVNSIGPSVNKKSLEDITGLSFDKWVERENYFSDYGQNGDLEKLSPKEVIEVFFDSINKGDKTRAISCLGHYSLLQSLTTNKDNNKLYNPNFSNNNSMVYNIVEGRPISYKLLDPDDLSELQEIGDRKTIEFAMEMYIKWKDDIFNSPDYMETRFAILTKYKNGWKLEGFGTGP